MMTFDIAHLSDLHFGNPNSHLTREDVARAMDAVLSQLKADTSFLVISGDITFQGKEDGYLEAKDAIKAAITRKGLPASNVLMCPGNHDIVKEATSTPFFTAFDAWSTGIRNDKSCTFAGASARLIQNDTADFLLLNSAYHADHKMGLVDLISTEKLLASAGITKDSAHRLRLAVVHHHVVPVLEEDVSTTRNAYSLIKLLIKYGFASLMHGHQHAMLDLTIGHNKLQISGVGSFGYSTPGYINSVVVYRGRGSSIEEVEHYGLTKDAASGLVHIKETK
ncbi:MAG: hypothetical protein EON54_13725 [Alcaligenaceae bacterium]|nr:MAG: hypothetical protein EON54_13725 [Alcaligenaceae bacterium]